MEKGESQTLSPLSALFFYRWGGKKLYIYSAVVWLFSLSSSPESDLTSFVREGKKEEGKGSGCRCRHRRALPLSAAEGGGTGWLRGCCRRGLLQAGGGSRAAGPAGRSHGHAGRAAHAVREGYFSAGLESASRSSLGCCVPPPPPPPPRNPAPKDAVRAGGGTATAVSPGAAA